ncbi:MAG: M42 family peptidase [Clostridia bacterium]|nr:M42 family peptidase [Clostridia bacterium]
MLEMIKELSLIGGPSGREENVRNYIISKLPSSVEYSVDAMGNLLVFVNGKKPAKNKVMLAAHMDEVGMIVTYITDDGLLKFSNVGGIETAALLGKRVKVGESEISGVIGVVPIHLRRGDDELKMPEKDALYIDVGADKKEQLESLVSLGDKIVFDSDCVEFGSMLKGKALDDRAGCAVMLDMIIGGVEYDTWFAFTVQEEVGCRGAFAAAYNIKPDYAVVIETTTAADISGVSGEKQVCKLGEGAVIPFMDGASVYNLDLYKLAGRLAEEKGFKMQTKTVIAGGNDARAISNSTGGVKTLTVSFATRYLHSASCVISKDDVSQMSLAVKSISEEFANA